MSAYLEREHFTVSQGDRYFTLEGLSKMIGQEANQWRHAALKELLDNALDAAESVYPATTPCIAVEISETSDGLTPRKLALRSTSPAPSNATAGNRPAGSSLMGCSTRTRRYKSEKLTRFRRPLMKLTTDSAETAP